MKLGLFAISCSAFCALVNRRLSLYFDRGSANYGIEVAFNHEQRMKFEKEVLFPLAGLNADQADLYYEIKSVMKELSYARNMIAQQYLDGEIDKNAAIDLQMKYSLTSREKSTQSIAFIEANRAYVINYDLGQDLVKQYVEKLVGEGDEEKMASFYGPAIKPKNSIHDEIKTFL